MDVAAYITHGAPAYTESSETYDDAEDAAEIPPVYRESKPELNDSDEGTYYENLKYTAEEIVGKLAYAYGLQEEPAPRTPESLVADFSWEKVPRHDICLPEGLF